MGTCSPEVGPPVWATRSSAWSQCLPVWINLKQKLFELKHILGLIDMLKSCWIDERVVMVVNDEQTGKQWPLEFHRDLFWALCSLLFLSQVVNHLYNLTNIFAEDTQIFRAIIKDADTQPTSRSPQHIYTLPKGIQTSGLRHVNEEKDRVVVVEFQKKIYFRTKILFWRLKKPFFKSLRSHFEFVCSVIH